MIDRPKCTLRPGTDDPRLRLCDATKGCTTVMFEAFLGFATVTFQCRGQALP